MSVVKNGCFSVAGIGVTLFVSAILIGRTGLTERFQDVPKKDSATVQVTMKNDIKWETPRNTQGQIEGVVRVSEDGTLLWERCVRNGQTLWLKNYWPNGNVRIIREEDWRFRTHVRYYDESGRLVNHDVMQ